MLREALGSAARRLAPLARPSPRGAGAARPARALAPRSATSTTPTRSSSSAPTRCTARRSSTCGSARRSAATAPGWPSRPSGRPRSTAAPRRSPATPPARPPTSSPSWPPRSAAPTTSPRRWPRACATPARSSCSGASGSAASGDASAAALLDLAAALRHRRAPTAPGLLEVPDVANARGLREAGCLPDAGPGLSAGAAGRSTEEIRAALESGELKALILFGVDPLRDFPDTDGLGGGPRPRPTSSSPSRCSRTRPPPRPTSSSRSRPTPRKTAPSPTPTAASSASAPRAGRPGDIRPNLQRPLRARARRSATTPASTPSHSAFAALTEAVPFYAGITDERDRRPRDSLAGPPRRERPPAIPGARSRPSWSPDTQREARPPTAAPPASSRRPSHSGTYRDLWAGPITELNPPLKFLDPAAAPRDLPGRRRAPGPASRRQGPASARTAPASRPPSRSRSGSPRASCFLAEGTADGNANAPAQRRPGQRRDRQGASA